MYTYIFDKKINVIWIFILLYIVLLYSLFELNNSEFVFSVLGAFIGTATFTVLLGSSFTQNLAFFSSILFSLFLAVGLSFVFLSLNNNIYPIVFGTIGIIVLIFSGNYLKKLKKEEFEKIYIIQIILFVLYIYISTSVFSYSDLTRINYKNGSMVYLKKGDDTRKFSYFNIDKVIRYNGKTNTLSLKEGNWYVEIKIIQKGFLTSEEFEKSRRQFEILSKIKFDEISIYLNKDIYNLDSKLEKILSDKYPNLHIFCKTSYDFSQFYIEKNNAML
jgi:hypothetical protein